MVYIRAKKVRGRNYYYLVKSVRRGKSVKQLNLEYLGSALPSKREIKKIKKKYE